MFDSESQIKKWGTGCKVPGDAVCKALYRQQVPDFQLGYSQINFCRRTYRRDTIVAFAWDGGGEWLTAAKDAPIALLCFNLLGRSCACAQQNTFRL